MPPGRVNTNGCALSNDLDRLCPGASAFIDSHSRDCIDSHSRDCLEVFYCDAWKTNGNETSTEPPDGAGKRHRAISDLMQLAT